MIPFCLSAEQIETQWGDFIVLLNKFEQDCQEIKADQIVRGVRSSQQQLFGLQDEERVHAIVVTEIQDTPRGLICVLVGACGRAPETDKRALLTEIENWAREIGCIALKIIGRKGWLRWDRRFKQSAVVAEMAL